MSFLDPQDQTTNVESQVFDPAARQPRAFVVLYHADRTRVIDLREGQQITFGRSLQASVPLDDSRVSRLHVAVLRRHGAIYARDLGSRNGTRLNGAPLLVETLLNPGDELAFGRASLVVGHSSPAAAASPSTIGVCAERLATAVQSLAAAGRRAALLLVHVEPATASAAEGLRVAREHLARAAGQAAGIVEAGVAELAALLVAADRDAAVRVAHEARAAVEARGAVLHAGVALFPDEASQVDELVDRARAALRAARRGGERRSDQGAPADARDEVVVANAAMHRVYELVERVARTNVTVLLLGETGVGKEVVADRVHRLSGRSGGPFVRLNCAALPETLLENELFGSERGAFTGAERRRLGYFEAAAGGTLLLDEIGELPDAIQAKLLRVLESRAVVRLGATSETPVDVRIIAATNRNLEAEAAAGAFRQDLYFRISTFTVVIPPLRDRRDEIEPLARAFVAQIADELGVAAPELTPAALRRLGDYHWPGNVRELRNVIERAVVLARGSIDAAELPESLRREPPPAAPAPEARGTVDGEPVAAPAADYRERIAANERKSLEDALVECGGNQTRAAERLGISRRALIYKMEKLGLKPPPRSR